MLGAARVLMIALAAALLAAPLAQAQTYSLLYSFKCGLDGAFPYASLVEDATGNLYGTTTRGGTYGGGAVFKLTPGGAQAVLHSFPSTPADGNYPVARLVQDSAGNLYGSTVYGGTYGGGTVFMLTPSGVETILYNFTGGTDGGSPSALVRDTAGNLYGTTAYGGASGAGVVFKVSSSGTETVLHTFMGSPTDGANPAAALVADASGNLYGTTEYGGTDGYGVVFEVTSTGTETVFHNFSGSPDDGKFSVADLIRDTAGNLYGTTSYGGVSNHGTVFELSPSGQETVLLTFSEHSPDGAVPSAGLVRDTSGTLYGTTLQGGSSGCGGLGCGIIFDLSAAGKETVLHKFGGPPADGHFPYGDLVRDSTGNLYGTVYAGGASSCGAVFKAAP